MKNQELLPKNSIKFKKGIFILSFIFIFAISLGFANFVSNTILPTNTQVSQSLSTPSFNLHFISLAKSQIENSAKSLAEDYQKIGAGGFTWKHNGYYHVIASCYEKENDALLVQNNIKANYNLTSQCFSVEFKPLTLSGEYEAESKKVLSKALKIFFSTYQQLFDIAISLDTAVYNEISARLAINNVYSNFNSVLTNFKTLYSETEDKAIISLNDYLNKNLKVLENLCSGKTLSQTQTYSSLIKYRYVEFLSVYNNFLNSF